LSEIGNVSFWKVAMKPGKPLAFGFIDDCAFLGLPGNPVSAAVTFDQLAKPFIEIVQNHPCNAPSRLKATANVDFKKHPGRMEFQRGIATCNNEGKWEVASAGIQGSAILSALSQANCHVILERESHGVKKGDTVTICLY
jgi:molybdopterin molybdotransferase